ncbi:VOC family protein [Achromobacter sp. GG226]|uniref:2-oxoadipate dioxygenase/decarboxylase HglS n=1 Tax=Verticiella alkaliphila TaxID=2779529 RepID=UPI00352FF089|nr:VOC family protein [Verticiella sp. GG226]
MKADLISANTLRSWFSQALSDMYRTEVPQYGTLLTLVADINASELADKPDQREALERTDELARLDLERHGAIRLGTAAELAMIRRVFAVLGMTAVGYYDLSVAGVPVHSTAFRPVDDEALRLNPFRVFTSLLRLELIEDAALRETAQAILARRQIFTPGCVSLVEQAEAAGGLTAEEGRRFVAEALETFRWHSDATVDLATYQQLKGAHPLIADVVCFKGPHINHLTPRVLDIDRAQAAMGERGMRAKASIEGPPRRVVPILLRQTSFLALEEPIVFGAGEAARDGTHTARFGEIEQRGCALTPAGRERYDTLLAQSRAAGGGAALAEAFRAFPDDVETLYRDRLIHVRYTANTSRLAAGEVPPVNRDDVDALVAAGWLQITPQVYEDFLPVSAAGIFQSNLGGNENDAYAGGGNRPAFEVALGGPVQDEFALYRESEAASLREALARLAGAAKAA